MKSVADWANDTVSLSGGTLWGEYEMIDFAYALEEIHPFVAVAITPFAFKDPESISQLWGEVIIADASLYGSILNH